MSETESPLRPMGIGDILDATFRLFKARFMTFLLIGLVVFLPYSLIVALLQGAMLSQGGAPTVEGGGPPQLNGASIGMAGGLIGTMLLFWLVVWPLCQAAMIQNISASYLGEELGAADSYKRALPRLIALLVANLLVTLVVGFGFLLLIVPGVIFMLWFMLVVQVVVLEQVGPTEAMKRSRELMRGNLGKGFLLALIVGLLGMAFSGVIGALAGPIQTASPMIGLFIQNVAQALILPIQIAPFILLYYDLRIRKEGFDLEHLAASLASEGPEEQPAGA